MTSSVPQSPGALRSVLHVLPHSGGGGETYVDLLSSMQGYRFERAYLSPDASPRVPFTVLRRALAVQRAASAHALLHVHGEVAGALCAVGLAVHPAVVTLHGLHLLRRLSGARRRAAALNLRLLIRLASRTICVSGAEYSEVLEAVGAAAAPRLALIRNGVSVPPLPSPEQRNGARAALDLAAGTTVGVFVASLDARKDPFTVARAALMAAAAGAGLVLLVAGEGPLRGALEQLARGEKRGTVRVLGHRRDVGSLLAAADFVVLPSKHEGLPFSLLEAMALGLPAVVSDVAGNVEVVAESGVVVPAGDIAGFAAAFGRMAADPAARVARGAQARERVGRAFRADDMRRLTRELYDDVLRSASSSTRPERSSRTPAERPE